jgi:hypothetical protein
MEVKMKLVRRKIGFASLLMVALMVMMSVPYQPVLAAMVPTDLAMDATEAQAARENLKRLIARADVQEMLVAQGIDPAEARARVGSLTDAEALAAAERIDQLPAGGSAVGIIVGALLIVFIVLLITDILGFTDVFPFVR